MTTPILTYSLRSEARNSDGYYATIARFADEWQADARAAVGDIVRRFQAFRRQMGWRERSEVECAFELLALGVLLREHGGEATASPEWIERALGWLVGVQGRRPRLEGAIKALRGWLGWVDLRRDGRLGRNGEVERLIAWLRANGERARAGRFVEWLAFFDEIGTVPARKAIYRCLALAEEFALDSLRWLGEYTAGVARFVESEAPRRRHRYDAEFVSRRRVEYHLGMLGTEVLSRAYRQRFRAAERKIVILPPCMRAPPESKCKAVETPFGARCQACTPTCRVHQITRLGEKRGFEVYMIPDDLSVFGRETGDSRLEVGGLNLEVGSLGVVGVSCALTNWSGGWEAEAMGVPAQGVLLDYVGCSYHWDDKGFATDVNLKRLEKAVCTDETDGN